MPTIDIDAARAARAEARKDEDPKTITFGGVAYPLPPECPIELATVWAEGDLLGGIRVLLGPDLYESFMSSRPAAPDLTVIVNGVWDIYQLGSPAESVALGESRASAGSSRKTGTRSRPISRGSTG